MSQVNSSVMSVSLGQAVALLKHRCTLLRFDGPLEDGALLAGAPEALLPILRYLFGGFSEALTRHLEMHGHRFGPKMSDLVFAQELLAAWPLISSEPLPVALTAERLLNAAQGSVDRLLFTMNALLVCSEKHHALSPFSPRDSEPFGLSGTAIGLSSTAVRPEGAAKSEAEDDLQSTMQLLVAAYREQLNSLDEEAIDGESDQAAWIAIMRANESLERSALAASSDFSRSSSFEDASLYDYEKPTARLAADARGQPLYQQQLNASGIQISDTCSDSKLRKQYSLAMAGLQRLEPGSLRDEDVDDRVFNSDFIESKSDFI